MIFDTDKGYLHEWKPYGRSDRAAFLCNRKIRSYYTKTLRGDAHCGVQCRCRKRPPQAQECTKAHSLFLCHRTQQHAYVSIRGTLKNSCRCEETGREGGNL